MNDDETKKSIFSKDRDGIKIKVRDPIQDVMSENEIDEASERFVSLLEDDPKQR